MGDYYSPSSMLAVSIALPVLGTAATGLRFYARHKQNADLLVDDWLVIPALIAVIGMGVSLIVGVAGRGIGYETPPAGPDGREMANSPEKILTQKVEFVLHVLAPVCLGGVKLSILYFYHRIFFVGRHNYFCWVTPTLCIIVSLWAIGFLFAFIFVCGTHFQSFWAPLAEFTSSCNNTLPFLEGWCISGMLLDLVILVLPLPMIWHLHLSLKKKISITLIFLLGTLTVVASIMKMAITLMLIESAQSGLASNDNDILITRLSFWTMLEAGLSVIASCLPTMHFLITRAGYGQLLSSFRRLFSLPSRDANYSRFEPTIYRAESSTKSILSRQQGSSNLQVPEVKSKSLLRDLEAQYGLSKPR